MENIEKVIAIVVTYNRKKLLMECLQALDRQTYPLEKIIIVDNASTDDTVEMIKSFKVESRFPLDILSLEKNIGGSGGFYEGMKYARDSQNTDFVWIMDDDTIPEQDALQYLLMAVDNIRKSDFKENVAYFISTALAENCKDFMNVPAIDTKQGENGYPIWHQFLKFGLVRITFATFVSMLIPIDVLNCCGLPVRDYFLWGDDSEYTLRLQKNYGCGYLVGNSRVIHKRKNGKNLSFQDETESSRIKLYYYSFRNSCINDIVYKKPKNIYRYFWNKIKTLKSLIYSSHGWLKIQIASKGIFDGCFRNKKFVEFIQKEIKK